MFQDEPTAAETEPAGAFADDPERLPEGSVVDGSLLRSDQEYGADFIVVGSGAAGGPAAFTLAEAGFRVAVIEEGPWVNTRQFRPEIAPTFQSLYRDAGLQVTQGRSFLPMLQGVCVGGGTTINSAIVWRLPEDVYDDWGALFGLGEVINARKLEPFFARIEQQLNVHAVKSAVSGKNNELMREGMVRLGIAPHIIERNERGCRGSARCAQGCPNGAKLSTAMTYIPWALERGARLYTNARVDKILLSGGRATGVVARLRGGGKLRVRANRGVVIAASTVQTPNLLRSSGLRSKAIGRNFMAHPGVGLGAVYEDEVSMNCGATQGVETIEFRRSDRYKLEALSLAPELVAVRVPGFGEEFMRRLAMYPHLAVWGVQVRARAVGTVDRLLGSDRVRFTLLPEDVQTGKKGLKTLAKIAFATGAREVFLGIHGMPDAVRSLEELRRIDEIPDDPRRFTFIATHLFGAARMGPDPRTSAVGLDFATHEAKGLYVVDSSLFPSNLGVNPQHAIMAIAMMAAESIAASAS